MPSVMIYIRQQDYDKWLAIENKPEWLHERLQSSSKVEQVPVKDKVVGSTPTSAAICKNGHPIPEGRTKCLGKGCKYS